MKLVGYADTISVAPGETVRFMVSAETPRYRADIVRLVHGDVNPDGPGFKSQQVHPVGEIEGREQRLPLGSYVEVADHPALQLTGSFTIASWIYATTPGRGEQGLVTKFGEAGGFGLLLDGRGRPLLRLSTGGRMVEASSGAALVSHRWYLVAASYDAQAGQAVLFQQARDPWPGDTSNVMVRQPTAGQLQPAAASLLIAATAAGDETAAHFNGKIDNPRIWDVALSLNDLRALAEDRAPAPVPVADWRFEQEIPSEKAVEVSGSGLEGKVRQMPARGVTGHNWTGDEVAWKAAPNQYGAIHFHDDDLSDAGWQVDFEFTVPEDLRSGVYAAHIHAGEDEDYIPFYVRPAGRRASSKILFLAPTNSYLAYGNEHTMNGPLVADFGELFVGLYPVQEQDKYIVEQGLNSLYDYHTDGSGVCYSSRLRPIVNMRPKVQMQGLDSMSGAPHQFNADLHLVDWLNERNIAFDVAIDEDLHREGLDLLRKYNVILTGSHPEYWSAQMLDAMQAYLNEGGRLMYLGANGFYWVTNYAPGRPHIVEIRRWGGTEAWTAEPGQRYLSTTGELGGLWRNRGRAPNRLAGVGFTAQGMDESLPFHRAPGSEDPRASWIFEGVGDEPIGDFGLMMRGAAGFEIDRVDHELGSPPNTIVLATASGFSDVYQHVIEEVGMMNARQGGTTHKLVRAEMTFMETANGGAVFSASSIAWCGSLSHNGYENNVARITANVLRRFAADGPLKTG